MRLLHLPEPVQLMLLTGNYPWGTPGLLSLKREQQLFICEKLLMKPRSGDGRDRPLDPCFSCFGVNNEKEEKKRAGGPVRNLTNLRDREDMTVCSGKGAD